MSFILLIGIIEYYLIGGENIMKKVSYFILSGFLVLVIMVSASAAGPGFGPGNNGGQYLNLPDPTDYNLTDMEISDLLFMREEEQMAHDLYTEWAAKYSFPVFENIAKSEETHFNQMQFLLDRYNLTSWRIGNLSTGYENQIIREFSAKLAEQGNSSLTDALKAGVLIEEQDISDLDKVIANTTREDIKIIYGNLKSGSENHLSAFNNQLS